MTDGFVNCCGLAVRCSDGEAGFDVFGEVFLDPPFPDEGGDDRPFELVLWSGVRFDERALPFLIDPAGEGLLLLLADLRFSLLVRLLVESVELC